MDREQELLIRRMKDDEICPMCAEEWNKHKTISGRMYCPNELPTIGSK